jgi:hypothetical protein
VKSALLVLSLFIATAVPTNADERKTYTVDEARAIFDYNQKKNPDQNWDFDHFANLRLDVPKGGFRPTDRIPKDLVDGYEPAPRVEECQPGPRLLGLKIRSSFSDALSSEDPTVQGSEQPETPKDLKGASFSYQRDFNASSDSWAATGALLLPITECTGFKPHLGDFPHLSTYGVIPSVSFDRQTNSADQTKEVDSLIFRLGLFARFTSGTFLRAQTVRLFGTYGTDFEFKSETPAAEFEYEPVVFFENSKIGIGSTYSLKEANSSTSPNEKRTVLAYLLRAYLHGEYGRTIDAGDKVGVSKEDFFRLGPKVQLTLDPLFTDRFAATVSYEYLPAIAGTTLHSHLFKAEGEYRITTEKEQKKDALFPIMSIKASYEEGGIDLTKEEVKQFLIGLAVTL